MLKLDGTVKCDRCGKTVSKEAVNYSHLPLGKEDSKLSDYCDECILILQKEFSESLNKWYT